MYTKKWYPNPRQASHNPDCLCTLIFFHFVPIILHCVSLSHQCFNHSSTAQWYLISLCSLMESFRVNTENCICKAWTFCQLVSLHYYSYKLTTEYSISSLYTFLHIDLFHLPLRKNYQWSYFSLYQHAVSYATYIVSTPNLSLLSIISSRLFTLVFSSNFSQSLLAKYISQVM